jgi:hypothetical protein
MTYFIKNGTSYRPTDEQNVDIRTFLPVGNYIIKADQFGNLFFETVDTFEFASKRYGDNIRHTQRIMDTFMSRGSSTGVMLAGEKGSGKSLLARTISMAAAELNIPTIIINAPWCGEQFNALIQSVEQPAVILFDEFEKVYNGDDQEKMLTLLDGVFQTRKLFVFTCNDKWRVDRHMRNRPGRIYYMIDFKGLGTEFIEEYCNDNLTHTEHIPTIIKISTLFTQFNFDMLKALVEEMNRYNESPTIALEMLNVRPEFDEGKPRFAMTLTRNGVVLKLDIHREWTGNPLSTVMDLVYIDPELQNPALAAKNVRDDRYTDDDTIYSDVRFTQENLTSIVADQFVYVNGDLTLTLVKVKESAQANWKDAF